MPTPPPPAAAGAAAGSTAAADETDMVVIAEGAAQVRVPAGNRVFYNNVQNVNRDLSVLVLNAFQGQREREDRVREEGRMEGRPGWRKVLPTWTSWGADDLARDVQEHAAKVAEESERGKQARAASANAEAAAAGGEGAAATPPPPPNDSALRILEALAASGLRSFRYAKEVAGPKIITANDLEPSAAESIQRNSVLNEPYPPQTQLIATHGDAVDVMTANRPNSGNSVVRPTRLGFHVVDLDPYGTPAQFLDSGVQAVTNGGLLCVTATDLAVLSGRNPETCMGKYGAVALNRPYGHEMAIRILLSCIDSHANRHGRFIVPLLSLKIDFYVRVFVRVYESQTEVKRASTRKAYVYQSRACDTYHLVPVLEEQTDSTTPHSAGATGAGAGYSVGRFTLPAQCPETGANWSIGGPMWSQPIHNFAFVRDLVSRLARNDPPLMVLKYADRVQGMLGAVLQELPDVPLYYSCASMGRLLHCSQAPLEKLQAALVNGGYRVSQSHDDPNVLKTDAPPSVLWDVWRCWVEKHPIAASRKEDKNAPGAKILAQAPTFRANFDPPPSVREARRRSTWTSTMGVKGSDRKGTSSSSGAAAAAAAAPAKWHPNPEAYWGPKRRAGSHAPPPSSSSGARGAGAAAEEPSPPLAKRGKQA